MLAGRRNRMNLCACCAKLRLRACTGGRNFAGMRAQALHRPPATGHHIAAKFGHVRGTGLMFCLPRGDNRGRWRSVLDAWVRAACGPCLRCRGCAKHKDSGKNAGNVSHTDPLDWGAGIMRQKCDLPRPDCLCPRARRRQIPDELRLHRTQFFGGRESRQKLASDKRSCSGIGLNGTTAFARAYRIASQR